MENERFDYEQPLAEGERQQQEAEITAQGLNESQAEWSARVGKKWEEDLKRFLNATRWEWSSVRPSE